MKCILESTDLNRDKCVADPCEDNIFNTVTNFVFPSFNFFAFVCQIRLSDRKHYFSSLLFRDWNKVSTSFGNAEFQHFSISATIKQTFSIRKSCSEGNNFLQASKTLSKERLLGFEKKFQRPGKNGPTYL